jgi:hypothetical protein
MGENAEKNQMKTAQYNAQIRRNGKRKRISRHKRRDSNEIKTDRWKQKMNCHKKETITKRNKKMMQTSTVAKNRNKWNKEKTRKKETRYSEKKREKRDKRKKK